MNLQVCYSLMGGDYNEVLSRLMKEELIRRFLKKFKDDNMLESLEKAVAEKEWERSVLTAAAEVSDALVEYNSARVKGDIDAQQVAVLEKNVEDTQELFRSDRNHSYLEVLQAESQLLNAKISKVTDDFNKMQAVVNLYSALGGGRK